MNRSLVAAGLIVASVVFAAFEVSPLFITWAQALPPGVEFNAGDVESVESAIVLAAHDAREHMRGVYSRSIFPLAGAVVLLSSALAFQIVRSSGRTK